MPSHGIEAQGVKTTDSIAWDHRCRNFSKFECEILFSGHIALFGFCSVLVFLVVYIDSSCEVWKSLSCVHSLQPHGLYSPWNSQAGILEWEPFPSPGDLPNPGIKPRPPALQGDSLPAEPQGKPKNPGVGSLSLLQQFSQLRNRIGISCLAGRFFTSWAIKEGLEANSEQPLWVKHSVSCVILNTERPNLALERLTVEEGSQKHITLLCSWNSPGKNPGVGSHFLLQGIFPT